MKIRKILIIIELILIFVLISNPVLSQSSADATMYQSDFDTIILDGEISTDEYGITMVLPNSADNKNFIELSWSHNTTHLAVGLSGELSGWMGFGQNSEGNGMLGANMIIGFVSNDVLTIGDYHAIGNSRPIEDEDQPSSLQSNSAGSDDGVTTTIEFIISFESDDLAGQDKIWKVGESYNFFVAAHESMDTLGPAPHTWHTNVLEVEITTDGPPDERYITIGATASYESNLIAAVAMALIFFSVIAIFIKQNRNINVV